jgi:hypothetical protein
MQATSLDFVAARMLNTKCPTWQIDLAEARTRFAQLSLLIGRKVGAAPSSSTNGYPIMTAFSPACQRCGPARRQKRLSDLTGASGRAG